MSHRGSPPRGTRLPRVSRGRGGGARTASGSRAGQTVGSGAPPRITVGPVKRRPCQDIRGPQKLVSYQIPTANPEKELSVIRAIIAREQSIGELLAHVSKYGPRMVKNAGSAALSITNACFGGLDQDTTDLLLRVRVTGVMVCEAVQDWRFQLTLPRPFIWQRKNYVQGMACDVNFLHFDKTVSTILGNGRTKRNPFVTEGRNINELAQFQWGGDPSAEPKSVLVSGVNAIRLKAAARLILEEEARCGKADAKMPPPAWYIQRKKRMLAMGINLQAGADESAENKSPARKSKPPPRRRSRHETGNDEGKPNEGEETGKETTNLVDGATSPSSRKKNGKKGKKRKRLLEMRVDTPVPVQTVPIQLPSCKRSHRYGRTRDGRTFLSRAVAWLLPPQIFTYVLGEDTHALLTGNSSQPSVADLSAQDARAATTITKKKSARSTATTLSKATAKGCGNSSSQPLPLPKDIDARIQIHVEIFLPNRSARDGCCGPAVKGATMVTTMKELENGGFMHADQISMGLATMMDAPLAVLPPVETKRRTSKLKPAKKTKRKSKQGPRAALIKRKADAKNEIAATKREREARILRVEAAMSFLLKRLVPTSDGDLAWRRDGPVVMAAKRSELRTIGASLSSSVDASFFMNAMEVNQSDKSAKSRKRRGPGDKPKMSLRSGTNWHHREVIRIGRFWCVVRSWIPWKDGGGLELEITTVSSPVTTKRLTLDLSALVRLLGADFFGKGKEDLPQKGGKELVIEDGGSNSISRPSSRGAGSRPTSRGAGSRPSSRGAGSRPSSRGVTSRPSSRGAGSRSGSRPTSRSASSRPSSRGAGRRRGNNRSNKRPSYVMASGVKIMMSDAPQLDVLSKEMLTKCVVVVETPHGPEFYAQAPTYIYDNSTPNIRLPTPSASSSIIAAAAAAAVAITPKHNGKGESASSTVLGGQRVELLKNGDDNNLNIKGIDARADAVPLLPPIHRPPNARTKVWQGGALVGGLHFLVDVHLDLATGEMHIQATYATSGSTISLTISSETATSCVAKGRATPVGSDGEHLHTYDKVEPVGTLSQRQTMAVNGEKMNDSDDEPPEVSDVYSGDVKQDNNTKRRAGRETELEPIIAVAPPTLELTPQNIACAVVERLDLDYNEPPCLILRNEDDDKVPLTGPLVALMASSSQRPFSPMLPVFTVQSKEENGSKNTVSTMTEASPERAEDPVRLDEEVKEAQLSRVEANVSADEHRKALASTKAVADGGLMVTIVPASPTKRIQPTSGSLLGIIHDKD